MKKYKGSFAVAIVILLVGTGIIPGISNTLANNISETKYGQIIEFTQRFSKPVISGDDGFIEITVDKTNSFITDEGRPMMPFFSKTIELPIGTKITNVKISSSQIKNIAVEKHIKPVPPKQRIDDGIVTVGDTLDPGVYGSSEPYPSKWGSYSTGVGLNKNNERVLFLSLHLYPARYVPSEKSIQCAGQIDSCITYEEPENEVEIYDVFDLVIISPLEFADNLQPLISHKNDYGMNTNLVTLEEIYNGISGRDNAEKIKYFVKHAIDEWNVKYVLLVGDIKKLPIRRTYASWWEHSILSDLYYGDIYNSEYQFCSWDANGNDKFGERYYDNNIDDVDLYADVHVGRLACTDKNEVDVVVDKIINYEEKTYGESWFKKIVLAGGDTFPPCKGAEPFIYEGEITNSKVAEQLPDFEHMMLWTSKSNLNALTFNTQISKGAGFVSYSGHGFEHGWGTYRPDEEQDSRLIIYYTPFLKGLRNGDKLPIVFFDACLTAKLDFNISDLAGYYPKLIELLLIITGVEYDTSIFYPCFGWSFVKEKGGGAIATIGATRSAFTRVDEGGVYGGAGYMNVHFFKAYEEGVTVGEMLTQAQNDYINYVGKDFFTIEEFILLGDPIFLMKSESRTYYQFK
jgi:hypothetical protein